MAVLGTIIMIYIVIMVIVLVICLGLFIIGATGSYTIAKNRGYDKAYFAFIPVANGYLLGAIADNINQCYNKKTNYRIWLTIGNALHLFAYVLSFIGVFNLFNNDLAHLYYGTMTTTMLLNSLAWIGMVGSMVIRYIVLYRIYTDYSPSNAVIFLMLSIFLGIYSILLFLIRKNPSCSTYYSYQTKYGNQQQQYYQSQGQYQNQNNYYQQQQSQQYYQQPSNDNSNNNTPPNQQ